MVLEIVILILSIIVTGVLVWHIASVFYQNKIIELKAENNELKTRVGLNDSIINEVKVAFSQIAQDSLKNQQERLLETHSADLTSKMELFKAEELKPINKLLSDFKESLDKYQKSYELESLDIKNAIQTAEKYARALTTNQNLKGAFGEEWLEQLLKFANLEENVHYYKQFSSEGVKPDFVVNLPNNNYLIIDSKVILKNYIDYRQSEDDNYKKSFISDLNGCINSLAKKDYEHLFNGNQPGFILMYVPIESCINLIYTDYDFKQVLENANSKNIIIVGSSSLLVSLRLVNQLWASKVRSSNVENIVRVGETLYNNLATHAQNLLNIRNSIEKAAQEINTEINRFKLKNNGSIFREAEKLKDYGIEAKSAKSGKSITEKVIPEELLEEIDE